MLCLRKVPIFKDTEKGVIQKSEIPRKAERYKSKHETKEKNLSHQPNVIKIRSQKRTPVRKEDAGYFFPRKTKKQLIEEEKCAAVFSKALLKTALVMKSAPGHYKEDAQ